MTSQKAPLLSKTSHTSVPSHSKKSLVRLWCELNRFDLLPAGGILMFWPCVWALAMVAYRTSMTLTEFTLDFLLYAFTSTLVHATGCIIDDIFDREFDRRGEIDICLMNQTLANGRPLVLSVGRTKSRPVASGAISAKAATAISVLQLALCVGILSYVDSPFKFAVGIFGIFPLGVCYPLMKRITYWPQAWLGLSMNWGFVLVWLILSPSDNYTIPAVILAGSVCWTLIYDTEYGSQDKKDDVNAGVKSTALLFGDSIRLVLSIFGCVLVGCIAYAGYLNEQGWPYYAVSVGGTSIHLLWQVLTIKPDVPADCQAKFRSNELLGFITFVGMFADYLRVSL